MSVEAQPDTGLFQPSTNDWPVWQWWSTVAGTCGLTMALAFTQSFDQPRGIWLTIFTYVIVQSLWNYILRHRQHNVFRVIAGREGLALWVVPSLSMLAVDMINKPNWVYTSLAGALLGIGMSLPWRKYIARWQLWRNVNIVVGIVTITTALFAQRAVSTSPIALPGNFITALIIAVGWSIVPGLLLARLIRTIPFDTWQDIQRQIHMPKGRVSRWLERWLFLIGLIGLLLALAIPGLRTCGWLDRIVGRSGCVQTIESSSGWRDNITWTQQGAFIADLSYERVSIMRLDDNSTPFDVPITIRKTIPSTAHPSPDGNYVAFIYTDRQTTEEIVQVWGKQGHLLTFPTRDYEAVIFSPDSQLVASGNVVWRIRDRQLVHQFDQDIRIHSFSSDGSLIATSITDKARAEVLLWKTDSWSLVTTMTQFDDLIHDVGVSPDQKSVAVEVGYETVMLKQISDGRTIWKWTASEPGPTVDFMVKTIAWSPDGSTLAVGGRDPDKGIVWLLRASDGTVVRSFKPSEDMVTDVAWSPDGTKLAITLGGPTRIWRMK